MEAEQIEALKTIIQEVNRMAKTEIERLKEDVARLKAEKIQIQKDMIKRVRKHNELKKAYARMKARYMGLAKRALKEGGK